MREISKAEERVCTHLRAILASVPVESPLPESEDLREVLVALEWFVPEVLQEIHAEWKGEGLDGIYPVQARKTGDREIEIIGLCCLMSDQTVTPLHLQLQLAPACDTISWFQCRLGEETGNGMRRTPYSNAMVNGSFLHVLKRLDSIEWSYSVGYGERDG